VIRHFCTYLDHRYLAKGLALYRSLEEHAGEFRLFVLCLSQDAEAAIRELALERLEPIALAELEAADPELLATKSTRETVEYYFTSTPVLMRHLFDRNAGIELLTYLDADTVFFSGPEPLFDEIGDASVAIVPHRFPEKLRHLERYGKYNVAWVTFRRDENGLACLADWRQRCLDWCYDREEDGKFADQKYLDDWPERFASVRVLRHPGADLAPWNISGHRISAHSSGPLVDDEPLVFFHAHRFDLLGDGRYEAHLDDYQASASPELASLVLEPYARLLAATGGAVDSRSAVGAATTESSDGTIRTSTLVALRDSVRASRGEAEAVRNELSDARSTIGTLRAGMDRLNEEKAAATAELREREQDALRLQEALAAAEGDVARLTELSRGYERLRIDWALERMQHIDEARSLRRALEEMLASRSWKLTAPLRWLMQRVRRS